MILQADSQRFAYFQSKLFAVRFKRWSQGYKLLPVISLFSIILFVSCSDSNQRIGKFELNGTWKLDSVSTKYGRLEKVDYSNVILDLNKNSKCSLVTEDNLDTNSLIDYFRDEKELFNFSMKTFAGKYFLFENPNRKLKTLILVPELCISGKDTIYKKCLSYDIVSLDKHRMVLINESEWYPAIESTPAFFSNEIEIYKRVER